MTGSHQKDLKATVLITKFNFHSSGCNVGNGLEWDKRFVTSSVARIPAPAQNPENQECLPSLTMRKSPINYKIITFLELIGELRVKGRLETKFRGESGPSKERWNVWTGSCAQSTG